MANTTGASGLRAQVYQKELFKDREDKLFFMANGMSGTDENNILQLKNDLKKEKGDTVNFGLTAKLSGAAVTGDSELEGNEEAVSSYSESVAIDQARFAVRLTGRYDEQRIAYNMREDAKGKLGIRVNEFLERQVFMKLGSVTTLTLTDVAGNIYSAQATFSNSADIVAAAIEAAGSGTRYICADTEGLDSLAETDILTTTLITRGKTKGMVTSAGTPRLQPIKIKGKEYLVMFVHPWQAADLKTAASSIWAQAQRDAQMRGEDNPIFTGALGIWDGVILHEHEYVPTCQTSSAFGVGGTAATARAFRSIICGCQAAVMAEAANSMLMVEKTFDYENKVGYAVNFLGGIQKPQFNSIDYAVVTVDTSATSLA
jgi:N4-gp56 family major capsid protein